MKRLPIKIRAVWPSREWDTVDAWVDDSGLAIYQSFKSGRWNVIHLNTGRYLVSCMNEAEARKAIGWLKERVPHWGLLRFGKDHQQFYQRCMEATYEVRRLVV